MQNLLNKLIRDLPALAFRAGSTFYWSPKTSEIVYNQEQLGSRVAAWSLLHEVGHALLEHKNYSSDFELVSLETQAWHKACEVGKRYGYEVEAAHIQDCLDTYRDWLHQRSSCPVCETRSFQQTARQYSCLNCQATWQVSSSRFCRAYRRSAHLQKTSPPDVHRETTSLTQFK